MTTNNIESRQQSTSKSKVLHRAVKEYIYERIAIEGPYGDKTAHRALEQFFESHVPQSMRRTVKSIAERLVSDTKREIAEGQYRTDFSRKYPRLAKVFGVTVSHKKIRKILEPFVDRFLSQQEEKAASG